jgi:hypothetical protein
MFNSVAASEKKKNPKLFYSDFHVIGSPSKRTALSLVSNLSIISADIFRP